MRRIFLTLFCVGSLTQVSVGQESMMKDVSYPYLDKLIATARANYPVYKMVREKVNFAHATVNRQKMGYFDAVNVAYQYSPNGTLIGGSSGGTTGGGFNFVNGFLVNIYLNVGNLVARPFMIKAAKIEEKVAMLDVERTELEIATNVKSRYFAYLQSQNVLKLRSQMQVDADNTFKTLKYRFEKGETTLTSYNEALMTYSNFIDQKLNAEATFLTAKASLEELLGTKIEEVK